MLRWCWFYLYELHSATEDYRRRTASKTPTEAVCMYPPQKISLKWAQRGPLWKILNPANVQRTLNILETFHSAKPGRLKNAASFTQALVHTSLPMINLNGSGVEIHVKLTQQLTWMRRSTTCCKLLGGSCVIRNQYFSRKDPLPPCTY